MNAIFPMTAVVLFTFGCVQTNTNQQSQNTELTSSFAKNLRDAKVSPNLVQGEVKGYVLTQIQPGSVYEKMGFQEGDVIEQVNGKALQDSEGAIQTLNSLKNENTIDVVMDRKGVKTPFKIRLR